MVDERETISLMISINWKYLNTHTHLILFENLLIRKLKTNLWIKVNNNTAKNSATFMEVILSLIRRKMENKKDAIRKI